MATQIQRRRGTTAQHSTFTGALGELTVDTDKKTVVVHDGITAGGSPLATLASPALTGVPTAPTAAPGTNTDQIASTEFVITEVEEAATVVGAFIANMSLPAGSLIYYAGSVAPAGYLEANGALLPRTAYAALFAAIGTIYNAGDGSTTFGLPDLRGEFIRGWDHGRGLDAGRLIGSTQSGGVPFALYHTSGRLYDGGSAGRAMDAYTNYIGTQSVPNAGELRPRNVAALICIKY